MSSSLTSSSSSELPAPPNPYAGMLDVVCPVDIVVGSGQITVRESLRLQHNSVIRLMQPAGSDLELRVHGIVVARGEVVIVNDTTAIRVTEILPPPGTETTS